VYRAKQFDAEACIGSTNEQRATRRNNRPTYSHFKTTVKCLEVFFDFVDRK